MLCSGVTKKNISCSRKAQEGQIYCAQHTKIYEKKENKDENKGALIPDLTNILIPDLLDIVISYLPLTEYYDQIGKNSNFTLERYDIIQKKLELEYIGKIKRELGDGKIQILEKIDNMILESKNEIERLKQLSDIEYHTSAQRSLFKSRFTGVVVDFINKIMYNLIVALKDTNIFLYDNIYEPYKNIIYYNIRSLDGHQIKKYFDIPVSYRLSLNIGEYPKYGFNSSVSDLVIIKLNKKSAKNLLQIPVERLEISLYKTFVDIIYSEIEMLGTVAYKLSDLTVYDYNPY